MRMHTVTVTVTVMDYLRCAGRDHFELQAGGAQALRVQPMTLEPQQKLESIIHIDRSVFLLSSSLAINSAVTRQVLQGCDQLVRRPLWVGVWWVFEHHVGDRRSVKSKSKQNTRVFTTNMMTVCRWGIRSFWCSLLTGHLRWFLRTQQHLLCSFCNHVSCKVTRTVTVTMRSDGHGHKAQRRSRSQGAAMVTVTRHSDSHGHKAQRRSRSQGAATVTVTRHSDSHGHKAQRRSRSRSRRIYLIKTHILKWLNGIKMTFISHFRNNAWNAPL
jgi:hypothetical protein